MSQGMHVISQHSLHDELLERLRKMIISGQFLPGDKIPERQLCEQFGISRTPLREALKVLAAGGLLQLAPNRGAVVTSLSAEEVEECAPVFEALEALSGELACEKITDYEINEIKTLNEEMHSAFKDKEMSRFFALQREFHEKIVVATQNQLLSTIYDTVFFRIGWARLVSHLSNRQLAKILADHRKMTEALALKDSQQLSQLLSSSFEYIFKVHRTSHPA